jgi:type I site-specific restriction-modification system R (restriction) subunit
MIFEFINFDRGTKMIARVNQVHAVNALKPKLLRSEGGVIWHTQGSGKSLTMVRTAKWIKENIDNSRVLILTDRTDLDESIEGVFQGVNETIHRTTSGKDLLDVLNTSTDTFVCSLIHKFKFAKNATEVIEPEVDEEGENLGEFAEEVKAGAAAYKNFAPKGKIYIFIDECHRTQAGVLHKAMKAILPDAVIIGFTGTPILKNDKALTLRIFGEFIHTYTKLDTYNKFVSSLSKNLQKHFDELTRKLNEEHLGNTKAVKPMSKSKSRSSSKSKSNSKSRSKSVFSPNQNQILLSRSSSKSNKSNKSNRSSRSSRLSDYSFKSLEP